MTPTVANAQKGKPVAKDKKKKSKASKGKTGPDKKSTRPSTARATKKPTKRLRELRENPLVADVVAAALVAMASALKDSEKARRLASDASDQLNALSKSTAKQGNAMWDMALDIGRRTLDTIAGEEGSRGKGKKSR
jgi:hypothetical protein